MSGQGHFHFVKGILKGLFWRGIKAKTRSNSCNCLLYLWRMWDEMWRSKNTRVPDLEPRCRPPLIYTTAGTYLPWFFFLLRPHDDRLKWPWDSQLHQAWRTGSRPRVFGLSNWVCNCSPQEMEIGVFMNGHFFSLQSGLFWRCWSSIWVLTELLCPNIHGVNLGVGAKSWFQCPIS